MTDKEEIREYLIGMANAECCNKQTAKDIKNVIIPYIDSMQEEPVTSVWHEYPNEKPREGAKIAFWDGQRMGGMDYADCRHLNGWLKTSKKWAHVVDLLKLSNVERTGKEWKEEPVSKDLEKEMTDFFQTMSLKEQEYINEDTFRTIARHFANWQKQQMLKDTVRGYVKYDDTRDENPYVRSESFYWDSPYRHLCQSDEIELIIIKK